MAKHKYRVVDVYGGVTDVTASQVLTDEGDLALLEGNEDPKARVLLALFPKGHWVSCLKVTDETDG